MGRRLHGAMVRRHAIHRMRLRLEHDGSPRLQMLLLVTMTGGVGFIASYLLLRVGVDAMWFRYLLALGIAYLAFLILLWLWLRTRAEDYLDLPDFSGTGPSQGPNQCSTEWGGQGGSSGGGGASSSFDAAGDVRNATTARVNLGYLRMLLGDYERAVTELRTGCE